MPPGVVRREFSTHNASTLGPRTFNPVAPLSTIRSLLKKPVLNGHEVELLLSATERLFGFAIHHMTTTEETLKLSSAVEIQASVFLLMNALYSSCQAVGPQARRETWWPRLVEVIKMHCISNQSLRRQLSAIKNAEIAKMLNSALETYTRGARPAASFIVPLKQLLLCVSPIRKFSRVTREAWRQDDKEWLESSKCLQAQLTEAIARE